MGPNPTSGAMNTSIMTNNLFITMLIIGGVIFLVSILLALKANTCFEDVLAVGALFLLAYAIACIIAYAGLGSVARRDACRTNAATIILKESPDITPSDLALSISKICK